MSMEQMPELESRESLPYAEARTPPGQLQSFSMEQFEEKQNAFLAEKEDTLSQINTIRASLGQETPTYELPIYLHQKEQDLQIMQQHLEQPKADEGDYIDYEMVEESSEKEKTVEHAALKQSLTSFYKEINTLPQIEYASIRVSGVLTSGHPFESAVFGILSAEAAKRLIVFIEGHSELTESDVAEFAATEPEATAIESTQEQSTLTHPEQKALPESEQQETVAIENAPPQPLLEYAEIQQE